MPAALDHVVDLIFGRWRSQILHAGVALDIFDHLKLGQDRPALSVASESRSADALPPLASPRDNWAG